ncbi:unnamed protein product, partial [Ectocarpus sp. 12 AP-2014]
SACCDGRRQFTRSLGGGQSTPVVLESVRPGRNQHRSLACTRFLSGGRRSLVRSRRPCLGTTTRRTELFSGTCRKKTREPNTRVEPREEFRTAECSAIS